ncbi:hypothetical protein V8D89_013716 [Ganoderma adspersum]
MSPHYYGYPPPQHSRSLGMSMTNAPVFVISRPMPQQPIPPGFRPAYRPSQSRQQPSRSRTKHQQTRYTDRRKRHGRVFDSNPLRGTVYDTDDVDSTWSMSGFVRPSRTLLRTSGSTGARARNSSPAQEIAARYRAAHTNASPASDTTAFLDVPHGGGFVKGKRARKESAESDLSDVSGPRLRYAVSQAHAMDRATREAYVMAVQCGGGYMNVSCQRPGCRAILPTIRDLASHLAMHDLEPRARYVSILQGLIVFIFAVIHVWHRSFASQPRYHSFLNMGHSVSEGRPRRRRMPPSPYSYFRRTRSKLRRYLANLTFRCAPGRVDDDDDFFF